LDPRDELALRKFAGSRFDSVNVSGATTFCPVKGYKVIAEAAHYLAVPRQPVLANFSG